MMGWRWWVCGRGVSGGGMVIIIRFCWHVTVIVVVIEW